MRRCGYMCPLMGHCRAHKVVHPNRDEDEAESLPFPESCGQPSLPVARGTNQIQISSHRSPAHPLCAYGGVYSRLSGDVLYTYVSTTPE